MQHLKNPVILIHTTGVDDFIRQFNSTFLVHRTLKKIAMFFFITGYNQLSSSSIAGFHAIDSPERPYFVIFFQSFLMVLFFIGIV